MPSERPGLLLLLCGAIALALIAALLPLGGTRSLAIASAAPVASRAAFPAWAHTGAATQATRTDAQSSPGLGQSVAPRQSQGNTGFAAIALAGALLAVGASVFVVLAAHRPVRALSLGGTPTPPPRGV